MPQQLAQCQALPGPDPPHHGGGINPVNGDARCGGGAIPQPCDEPVEQFTRPLVILLPDELPLFGAVLRPENYAVANAIGASIAQVGGEVDKVVAVTPGHRDQVLDEVRQEALDKAVAAGARPGSVQIIEMDEVPIPYLPGNATRIRVKAVGDLDMDA